MQNHSTSWRVKVPAHQAGRGPARIVVNSIGTAGVALVHSLRHALPASDADIAALLLQAPSELLKGLERPQAEAMVKLLRETGLDCTVLDPGEVVREGSGDHEVALFIREVQRIPAVLVEVMRLLGVDVGTARSLICSAPAVLLGGVSEATVSALRARFGALGADVDASRTAEARFDVLLGDRPASVRDRTIERLRATIGPIELSAVTAQGPIAVLGLSCAAAERALRELRQADVPVRVVNREFARYDVVLRAAEDNDGVRRHLIERAGIPAAVVPRVLANLPVVVHRGLRHADLEPVLADLALAGAEVVAERLASQRFNLTLGEVREVGPLVPVISAITGMDEAVALTALRGRPARLTGPFPPLQARWLQHELRRAGVDARLEAL